MDRFFGLDSPATQKELVHIFAITNPVDLSIAQEVLDEAGIPYLKKERGAGGVVRLVTGFQSFGTDLFVRPEDAERAVEVLTPVLTPVDEASDSDATDEET